MKAERWEKDVMVLTLTSAFLLSKVLAAAMTNTGEKQSAVETRKSKGEQ